MYFDGSVMKTGAGAGLLFVSPLGEHIRYVVRLHFPASNNMAEYEALLNGLRIAIELGIKRLDIWGDSQLVIDQVIKDSSCHDEKMEAYCNAVRCLEDKFHGIELNHIARRYNEEEDELAKIASGRITIPPNVFSRDCAKPSVDFKNPAKDPDTRSGADPSTDARIEPINVEPSKEELEAAGHEASSADEAEAMEIDEAPVSRDWRNQYLAWINQGGLPSDRIEARRIARRAKSFVVIDGELYRRSTSGILQCCIPIPEGRELIRDIHAGVCGHHAAPRTLVGNAFRQGFYWPRLCAPAKGASSTHERPTCEGC
ncbi:unnamed protein product [Urochloa humidicola]